MDQYNQIISLKARDISNLKKDLNSLLKKIEQKSCYWKSFGFEITQKFIRKFKKMGLVDDVTVQSPVAYSDHEYENSLVTYTLSLNQTSSNFFKDHLNNGHIKWGQM